MTDAFIYAWCEEYNYPSAVGAIIRYLDLDEFSMIKSEIDVLDNDLIRFDYQKYFVITKYRYNKLREEKQEEVIKIHEENIPEEYRKYIDWDLYFDENEIPVEEVLGTEYYDLVEFDCDDYYIIIME